MNLEQIEDYIENLIENELKPEIKERFIYQLTDEIKKDKDKVILAETIFLDLDSKPLIKFYTESIKRLNDKPRIKRIISHEIAHTFKSNESQANSKQNMNIWQMIQQ